MKTKLAILVALSVISLCFGVTIALSYPIVHHILLLNIDSGWHPVIEEIKSVMAAIAGCCVALGGLGTFMGGIAVLIE